MQQDLASINVLVKELVVRDNLREQAMIVLIQQQQLQLQQQQQQQQLIEQEQQQQHPTQYAQTIRINLPAQFNNSHVQPSSAASSAAAAASPETFEDLLVREGYSYICN